MSSTDGTEKRLLSGGFDPRSGNWVHRGLDLSKPTVTTPEEEEAFKQHYAAQFGGSLSGLDWWFGRNPEVLKRYRLYCSLTLRVVASHMGNGTLAFYMMNGYEKGIRYFLLSSAQDGLSKAELHEVIAMAFVHAGPRGMQALQNAIKDVEFNETPNPPVKWPEGWAPDIEAFRTGLDFDDPELSTKERRLVEDWYMRTIGEIPGHVTFLANHRPMLLKSHRARVENMLYVLPKQMWPTCMLYYHVMTRCPDGLRENALLCKAWGVSKSDTLDTIGNALVYGQMEAANQLQRVCADVFDSWQ